MADAIQTEQLMQIGELARRAEVTPRTIKYYEELGLMQPAGKSEGGFRLYNEDNLLRLQRIKQMIDTGFSLAVIGELLELVDTISQHHPGQLTSDERARLISQVEERVQQIAEQVRRQEAELEAGRKLHHDLQVALENIKYIQIHGVWPESNKQ